VYLVGLHTNY
jgi:hypothetical protein